MTVVPEIPADVEKAIVARTAAAIAGSIRAELVCCDVFERLAPLRAEVDAARPGWGEAYSELHDAIGAHDICYWGEAAARLAEDREDEEQPEVDTAEDRMSAEGLASIMAVVDAPYRPGLDVEYADELSEPDDDPLWAAEQAKRAKLAPLADFVVRTAAEHPEGSDRG